MKKIIHTSLKALFMRSFPVAVFIVLAPFAFGQLSVTEFLQLNDPSLSFDTVARSTISVVKEKGKFGLINAMGEWVVSPVYDEIGNINPETNRLQNRLNWKNGMVVVKKLGKYGVINFLGQEVIPCKYADIWLSENGDIQLRDGTGKNFVADKQGKIVTGGTANTYTFGFRTAWRKTNDGDQSLKTSYSFINKKGDTIFKLKNSSYVFSILGHSEGMTAFVMYPIIFGGLGKTYGTVGFLGPDGKIAIPPIYSAKYLEGGRGMSAWEYQPAFHSGRALVFRGDSTIYIDKTGKEVLNFKDKPGLVDSYNDFNANGLVLIYYNTTENGKIKGYSEIIDTTGKVLLQFSGAHIGNDGIDYTTISKYKYFYLVSEEGKTLYNDKLEKQFYVPRSDENYKYYYYSFPEEILSCVFRKNKTTGVSDYTFINRKGEQVCGYIPTDRYYDPITGSTILKSGNGLIVKNKSDETIYSCDSCSFDEFHKLSPANNRYTPNTTGIFSFWDLKTKEVFYINHNGTVIGRFSAANESIIRFQNISEEYERNKNTVIEPEPEVKISVKQAELDKIYQQMPWKNKR